MDDPAYIATLNLDEGIPLQIKVLNGAKIEIEGFMFPLEGEVDNLQLLCCLKTKWRAVSVPFRCLMSGCTSRCRKTRRISSYQDELVTLYGTLHVGAKFEDDMLTGIYHLELDRLDTDALKLGRF